jgi:hypothetical protein
MALIIGGMCLSCILSSLVNVITSESDNSSMEPTDNSSMEPILSKKQASVKIYDTRDCTGDPFHNIYLTPGADVNLSKIEFNNTSLEKNACCIETENMNVTGNFLRSGEIKNLNLNGNKTELLVSGSCPNEWNFEGKIIE